MSNRIFVALDTPDFEKARMLATGDRQQPGPGVVAAHAVEGIEGPQKRFLHDVARVLGITRQPACQVECGVQMRQGQRLKAPAPLRQVGVVDHLI